MSLECYKKLKIHPPEAFVTVHVSGWGGGGGGGGQFSFIIPVLFFSKTAQTTLLAGPVISFG